MKKLIFSLFLVTLTLAGAFGADSYEVFFTKGKVTHKLKNNAVLCTRGMTIMGGELILENSANLVLVNQTGQNLKLTGPGNFMVDDLSKAFTAGKSDITSDYFKYVWKEMSQKEGDKNVADVKGSVYRGDILMFFPPDSCNIMSYSIDFVWKGGFEKNYFLIRSAEQNMVSLATKDTTISFYIDSGIFQPGQYYQWEVGSTNPPPSNFPPFHFKILTNEEVRAYQKEIKDFKRTLDFPEEINLLILAGYCVEKKLYMEAIEYFELALKIATNREMVEEAYAAFLSKIMRSS
jgi:tetratricopeptide (TPR) repeat protein